MSRDREDLRALIATVRRRWRMRRGLRGATILMAALVAVTVFAGVGLTYLHFTPGAILGARIIAYLGLTAVLAYAVALPLVRRVSDAQVARYIEEHDPRLDALLVSAVDSEAREAETPGLVRRLVAQAVAQAEARGVSTGVERRRLRRHLAAFAVSAAGAALLLLAGPGVIGRAGKVLFVPWSQAAAEAPFAVLVSPGHVAVPKGADLDIAARLRGFTSERVTLLLRPAGRQDWERVAMEPADTAGAFGFRLFDLQEPTEYLVESNGVSSPVFRIDVTPMPYVDRIDLEYRYPAYTGLATEMVENGGDIVAPAGTRVRLLARPTMPVTAGRVILDADTVALAPVDSSTLSGTIAVQTAGHYRIELLARTGAWVPASLEYRIDVLEDHAPSVTFAVPGRDLRVTAVEEVAAEAVARDDFGVRTLELRYTVNGGPEQRVALYDAGRTHRTDVSGRHTFLLEEFGLEPGDLVSYYAVATETGPVGRTVSSDIYFLQVRPFAVDYRQAEQQGSRGQQSTSPEGFSERQRQIVAGTFKVERDRATAGERRTNEDLATLALAEGRLRAQVNDLVERLAQRSAARLDSTFAVVAQELQAALPQMRAAEESLGTRKATEALPPEQKALQHLQRAEAAFREIQVSQGGGGGGGGGNATANADELADLFELETDKLRNQYETVERGERQAAQAAEDEAAERLRQLAARQQQENERLERAAQQLRRANGGSAGGAGGSAGARAGQRALAQEAEEAARQLERLAREQRSDDLAEAARRLQQAAQAMQRAAAGNRGSDAEGQRALEQIREATRRLESGRMNRLGEDIRSAREGVERLRERQREIAGDVDRLMQQGGSGDPRQAAALAERKDSLASAVTGLEATLERIARDARRDQGEAARRLAEAAGAARDNRIADKIRFSKGLMRGENREYARSFEQQIGADLDEVRARIDSAAQALAEPGGQRAGRALDRAGDLRRGLESLGDRARAVEEREGQGQGEAGARGGGRPGVIPPDEARRLAGDVRAERARADTLRRLLIEEGVEPGPLDEVIGRLRRLESVQAYQDPRALARLQEAAEAAKAFEFALRRRLLGDPAGPLATGADKVPPQFRDAVAEYYRSLARRNTP